MGWRLLKNMKAMWFLNLYWINLAVLLSHIILDSFTMYGIQWLAPFSDHKISMDLLFVVDAYFTLGAMIVLAVLYVQRTTGLRWLVVAGSGHLPDTGRPDKGPGPP